MKTSITSRNPRESSGGKRLRSLGALAFWLLVWQGLALLVNKPYLLASPVQAAHRLLELGATPVFWLSVAATCLRVLAGFLAALVLGILLAGLSARFGVIKALFAPLLEVIRATPVASFIILALVWLTASTLPMFIAFLMVLPMVYTNLAAGIANLDPQLLEMARLFRLPRERMLRLIYLPGLMPYVTAAATSGLGFAWKSAIAAEVIAHPALSMGKRIWEGKLYVETPDIFAWTIAVILMSVLLERGAVAGLRALERRLLRLQHKVGGGAVGP